MDAVGDPDGISVASDVTRLGGAAQALFERGERASFDLGADWFELLVRHGLPDGCEPRFYQSSTEDDVRCVLPVFVCPGAVSGLTTFYTSLYRPLMAEGAVAADLAGLVRRLMRDTRSGSLRLDPMDPSHPSFVMTVDAMRLAGLRPFSFFAFGNWYLPVAGRDYQTYLAGLPSRLRNTLRRREKRFRTELHGRIEMVQDGDGLAEAVSIWQAIYGSSWKREEPYPDFMPQLIALCARRGWLRMAIAYLGDTPVAAQIWIVNAGRAAIYKLAHDERYARYSVGTLLTARLMQHVLDVDRVHEVDYLIGDDAYKRDWMDARRERHGIVAFDPHSLRGLAGIARQRLGDLRRRFIARQRKD